MKKNQKSQSVTKYFKAWPWHILAEDLARRAGWKWAENNPRRKIFDRRNERIVAVKLGLKEWKAEHFIAGKLVDSSGIAQEEFVKRIIYEMGIFS
ncbi:MAG TPA: hypothetical protein VJJ76_02870 [archaeon]|nr:hypothetical protein [archaeon]